MRSRKRRSFPFKANSLWAHLLLALVPSVVTAGPVRIDMIVDDPVLNVGEITVGRVFATIENGEMDNGVYAYALSIAGDPQFSQTLQFIPGATWQPGMPEPFFSGPGLITNGGWFDVYGGSGGFYGDPSRGVGTPFELLTFEIEAIGLGQTVLGVMVSEQALALGAPDGILLQRDEPIDVLFGQPVLIVVPEPSAGLLVLTSFLVAGSRSFFRKC